MSVTAINGLPLPSDLITLIKNIIEEIAFTLGRDALEVWRINYCGVHEHNVTPYNQTV